MSKDTITPIELHELEALDGALKNLSDVLGDSHLADLPSLKRALFGPYPAIHALLARNGDEVLGAVVFSPVFSTVYGAAGLYVSDLWVDASARGAQLGERLLGAAAMQAQTLWHASYIKLAVYQSNPRAYNFYDRLGFRPLSDETTMILDEKGIKALKEIQ